MEKRRIYNNKDQSRRTCTYKYSLPTSSLGEVEVCKKFYMDTLGVCDKVIYTAIKLTKDGFSESDKRGKNKKENKFPDEKDVVRRHIESFPATESHYCRKETKRTYLDGQLSLRKMYKMYKEDRQEAGESCVVSEALYKKIFYTEYNISFYKKAKDRCDFCTIYKNADEKTDKMKEEYETHLKMKDEARKLKDLDMKKAKEDNEFAAATFDLEDVLKTPKGNAKGFYYKRSLNTYNLSIFDYGSDLGINNIWNERVGKRGSNEIGSCIYKYVISQVEKGKRIFSFYSDACGGQNRNTHITALMWWLRCKYNLKEIKQTFFVSGHSQSEVDGIHSRVEDSSRLIDVYTTAQWAAIIRSARQKPPVFQVNEFGLSDIKDIKAITEQIFNLYIDTEKNTINYLKIKRIRITEEKEHIIEMSYDYDENSWFELNIQKKKRKVVRVKNAKDIDLHPVRDQFYEIDDNKLKDLDELCKKGLIPQVHHSFFNSLHD